MHNKLKCKKGKIKNFYSILMIIILLLPIIQGITLPENTVKLKPINTNEINSNLSTLSTATNIDIIEVKGGLNFEVTLKNQGNYDLRNIKITTRISGGILLTPRVKNYTIPQILADPESNTYTIQNQIIGFGFGIFSKQPSISVLLTENNEELVIGQIDVNIFGIKVIVTNSILNEENIYDGYTLYTPEYSKNTYLINNNGKLIHQWNGKYIQGMETAILKNGNMIRADMPYPPHPSLLSGGLTGHIGIYTLNGESTWDFTYSTNNHCLHHGFEVLPNGNILMVAVESKSKEEALNVGRNSANLNQDRLCPDYLIEVKPNGTSKGDIVWKWHVWDHLIQDYDESKNNYESIKNHPELININYGTGNADFTHINSIDYNEKFDQIIVSVREFNEIWVIDHSTTTEEAAGHTGGRYGKGGDLLYRWGNPAAYNAGNEHDQQLFAQHDAQWIPPDYPGEGNILIFNNQVPQIDEQNPNLRAYSSIVEITPPINEQGVYTKVGLAYAPINPKWTYTAKNVYDFYSSFLSSAQRLPNGNTLICEGNKGRIFEVNKHKEIVWQYQNKYGIPNHIFNIEKYSPTHPGIQKLLKK